MNLSEGSYRIPIDGAWDLEDLYVFPRAYEQVYFLVYALLPHDDEMVLERLHSAFAKYPWRGGYSAVNFYNQLRYTTPRQRRPQVLSLQYASPGIIELSLIVGVAVAVEKIVKAVCSSIRETNATYNEVQKGLSERKLLRIEVELEDLRLQLEKEHAAYIRNKAQAMAGILQIENLDEVNRRAGSPLISLKILLSLYRRVRTLANYQENGKTKL